jgi:hypothetical protein
VGFNDLKEHNGQKYKGMPVGAGHHWDYDNGKWVEKKVSPDLWEFEFQCCKNRHASAPKGSGAPLNTEYFWYIVADQKARKVDADNYHTMMKGLKFKVAHKRPHWRSFSCEYPDQMSETEKKIKFLQGLISKMEGKTT